MLGILPILYFEWFTLALRIKESTLTFIWQNLVLTKYCDSRKLTLNFWESNSIVIAMNMEQTLFTAFAPKYFVKHWNIFINLSYDAFMLNSDLTLIEVCFINTLLTKVLKWSCQNLIIISSVTHWVNSLASISIINMCLTY